MRPVPEPGRCTLRAFVKGRETVRFIYILFALCELYVTKVDHKTYKEGTSVCTVQVRSACPLLSNGGGDPATSWHSVGI